MAEARIRTLLLVTIFITAACGQSSSPSSTAPTPSCAYSLSISDTINGYPDGGTFPVGITVTQGNNCGWTSVAFASWLHVAAGASGTGSGTTTFTADANAGEARTGSLTIAGEVVMFHQSSRH